MCVYKWNKVQKGYRSWPVSNTLCVCRLQQELMTLMVSLPCVSVCVCLLHCCVVDKSPFRSLEDIIWPLSVMQMSGDKDISAFPETDNLFKWIGTINGPRGTVSLRVHVFHYPFHVLVVQPKFKSWMCEMRCGVIGYANVWPSSI